MQDELGTATKEITVLLLVAGWLLIGAGLASVAASAALAVGLAVATAAAYLLRVYVPDLGVVVGHDVALYLRDGWIALALATAVVAYVSGASPGELQTLGGLLGLAGMLNYFLRPLYFAVYGFATSVAELARPENG